VFRRGVHWTGRAHLALIFVPARLRKLRVSGQSVKLVLYGYNVTTDDSGCGTNSQKVYYHAVGVAAEQSGLFALTVTIKSLPFAESMSAEGFQPLSGPCPA
jgi:hypothetical protein